jgi:membrane protein DedA with SNARE-associated domain
MLDTQALIDAMESAYATWGYPIVFLGAMLENTILLGLLLPGGTLVVLGAVYAQNGAMELPLVLLLAWVGTILGASLDFMLGRFGLQARLAETRLHVRLEPRLDLAERFLQRYGIGAFVLAHFAGHIRSFVAITAGITNLPVRRFLLAEGIAALVWNTVFVGLGFALGKHVDTLQRIIGQAGLMFLLAAVLGYGTYYIIRRVANSRRPAQYE